MMAGRSRARRAASPSLPPDPPMYYDDETRRFNFLSGLLFGAVLGAGLGLIAAPQDRVRALASVPRRRKSLRKRTGRRIGRFRDEVADSVSEMVTTGRRYLRG